MHLCFLWMLHNIMPLTIFRCAHKLCLWPPKAPACLFVGHVSASGMYWLLLFALNDGSHGIMAWVFATANGHLRHTFEPFRQLHLRGRVNESPLSSHKILLQQTFFGAVGESHNSTMTHLPQSAKHICLEMLIICFATIFARKIVAERVPAVRWQGQCPS